MILRCDFNLPVPIVQPETINLTPHASCVGYSYEVTRKTARPTPNHLVAKVNGKGSLYSATRDGASLGLESDPGSNAISSVLEVPISVIVRNDGELR